MTSPAMPIAVADAIARYPAPVRDRILEVRELIFEAADGTESVGELTETLKWGEPAYLTEQSKSGTTIRLGVSKLAPEQCSVFFNCNTTLVDTFRTHFPEDFTYEGNRALNLPQAGEMPHEALRLCLIEALTYHQKRKASAKT